MLASILVSLSARMAEFTHWLNNSLSNADGDQVVAQLYTEMKRLAASRVAREGANRTLGATSLVHEAWLRIEKSSPQQWRDRRQFFAAMAEAMRRILVEAARRRLAAKRGGGERAMPVEDFEISAPVVDERLLRVHEALDRLEAEDEMKAKIVKLRFFSGMSNQEIAALLEVNEKTVRRHWTLAKVWLFREMGEV